MDINIFFYFCDQIRLKMKFFRKYHKWLGIVLTLFIILFALSGIVLNHRNLFSGADISRNLLPQDYGYTNWNNASVKGSLKLKSDSILVYGNVGIWQTDSSFNSINEFMTGLPDGIDNRKIFKILESSNGDLFAATLFGLYKYNIQKNTWEQNEYFKGLVLDISQKQDTLLLLNRSHLYKTTNLKTFTEITLPSPIGYDDKVGLFKTLWVIHSGEIYGHLGVLFTDFIGLVFIFLSITGLIYWLAPKVMRRRRESGKNTKEIAKLNRFSLKWHNKLGWILLFFLVLTTATGMFLRPPLLIAIANSKVGKIPFSELDTPNAWYDKLRKVVYDEQNERYVFATIDGLFTTDTQFKAPMMGVRNQPPISVMGVNVFEQIEKHMFLVGSFEGLFVYDELSGKTYDYIERKEHQRKISRGKPIGQHMVAGFSRDFYGGQVFFDYNSGAQNLTGAVPFVEMPKRIENQQMSLWNLALEIHTMRIWGALIGSFYILLIPLSGLSILFILISGFIVWFKMHRKKRR